MKRKVLMIAMISVLAAAGLVAEGRIEKGEKPEPAAELEAITLTGTLDFSGMGPVLVTEEGSYSLMVGRFLPEGLEVENGDEVTVEGFLAPEMHRNSAFSMDRVMVTKAIVDGVEYEIEAMDPGMGRMGGPMRGGEAPQGGMKGREAPRGDMRGPGPQGAPPEEGKGAPRGDMRGPGPQGAPPEAGKGAPAPLADAESVNLSGTVEVSFRAVTLVTEEGSYSLMLGRDLPEGLELETGDSVSVEGFLPPATDDESEAFFMVTKITVDGTEYEIGRPGPGGPNSQMMGADGNMTPPQGKGGRK